MRYYGLLTTCFFFSSESRYLRRFEVNTAITDHAFECPQLFSNTLLRRIILPFGINCIYAFWKALFKDKMSVDDATYWYTRQYNSISLRNPFGLIQLVSWRGLLKPCFDHKGILLNTAVVESFIQRANACLRYLLSSATSLI